MAASHTEKSTGGPFSVGALLPIYDAQGRLAGAIVQHAKIQAPGYVDQHQSERAAFTAVDTDGSGAVSAVELREALRGDFPLDAFSMPLCNLLVRIFDTDHSGVIEFGEFVYLFSKLKIWKQYFLSTHSDVRGQMTDDGPNVFMTKLELGAALRRGICGLGPLPATIVDMMLQSVNDEPYGRISFAEFVRTVASLEALMRVIRSFDPANTGRLNLTHADLLVIVSYCWA